MTVISVIKFLVSVAFGTKMIFEFCGNFVENLEIRLADNSDKWIMYAYTSFRIIW